jgi:phosphoenolpyruvate carboxykinase (ATP)
MSSIVMPGPTRCTAFPSASSPIRLAQSVLPQLFIDDPAAAIAQAPEFTVIDSPSFKADPQRHGTRTEVVIALNFAKKLVLIGGTSYAGEMKKSIFSVLNYILPLKDVLSMHCSANIGATGDVAVFFGPSGPGKTTL